MIRFFEAPVLLDNESEHPRAVGLPSASMTVSSAVGSRPEARDEEAGAAFVEQR